MNTLKAFQQCFPRARSSLFLQQDRSYSRCRTTICFSNSDGPGSKPSIPEGDKQKQELLAQIAMLQAQKVRLTDFLDDRSAHLSQLAEDANAEFDAIGENALKELEDAGSRILDKLESKLQAFEESSEMNRQEIESNERILEELEEQIVRDRNEGLFFKNLRQDTPKKQAEIKEEAQNLRQVGKKSTSSRGRRNVYLSLMALMVLAVGNALFSSPVEWKKVGVLSLILVGLLAQFIYELSMSSTTDETNKK